MQGEERSHHPSLTPAERELEDALRGLSPAASKIDRDRVLFDAGAAAASERSWRLGFAAAALAIGLALSLLWRPQPQVVERVVYVPAPTTQSQPAPRSPSVSQPQSDHQLASVQPDPAGRRLQPVPIPVPAGPFVAMPPGFVNVSRTEFVSDARRSPYFVAIQNVVRKGLGAIPSTRTIAIDRDEPSDSSPAGGGGATEPEAGEQHPS